MWTFALILMLVDLCSLHRYRWEKDGEEFDVTQYNYIDRVKGLGTLVIHRPTDADEGYYQCFAFNSHGSTSVSIKAFLTKSVQDTFPSAAQPTVHRPVIGYPLTLRCHPPKSIPVGIVLWATTEAGSQDDSTSLEFISYDDRITKDLDGLWLHLFCMLSRAYH